MFAGVHTALATPFQNGQIDAIAYKRLIDYQFANGIQGVVPAGTTGESPTLTYEEHDRIIELAIEYTAGRGLVIAGTGSNSTAEAIEMTQTAEKAGAQASLQVCPYLQQAVSGRAGGPFSRDRRFDQPPAHSLQCPRTVRRRNRSRDHRDLGGDLPEHRSHQGGRWQRGASQSNRGFDAGWI